MKNAFTRLLTSWLYLGVQRCLHFFPAGLIRFRPFGVYEIKLKARESGARDYGGTAACQARWITSSEEAQELAQLATQENIAQWNGQTRRAAVLWKEGRPVAVAWIATGSFAEPELGLKYRLDEDEVWLFAAVVDPVFRGQGFYRQLLEFVIRNLALTPTDRILLGVSTGNRASERAHTRQGATRLGSLFAIKSCQLTLCLTRGQVRRTTSFPFAFGHAIEVTAGRLSSIPLEPN